MIVSPHEHHGGHPDGGLWLDEDLPAGAYARAAALFRAVGDEERLKLLAQLRGGERCVTELAQASGAQMSTVSQRLRVLRAEGLVARRRDGRHLLYRLTDDHVAQLLGNALAHADEAGRAASAVQRGA